MPSTYTFNNELKSGNILLCISEHFSQFLSINRLKISLKKINIYQRDYSKFETQSFRNDILLQTWNCNSNNVNEMYNVFINKLEKCVDVHAPMKKLNKKDLKKKSKPWITTDIIKLIEFRNKLFRKKKNEKSNENAKLLYNKFRNRVNREMKKAKKIYYNQYFEDNKNDIKKTWIGIKSIINTKNEISPKTSQLNVNGNVIDDPKCIANSYNNFFTNVGFNIDKDIPIINKSPESFLKQRNDENFLISHVTHEELIDLIKTLDSKKGSGPSSIPVRLLLLIPDLIVVPLCQIINKSFDTGVFPESLKTAKVISIFKKGSTQDVNNYRPISLLSIFDKIFEKLMYSRLYNFLDKFNILYEHQYGFRKNKSTIHSLMQITEQIKFSLEKGMYGCGIFLDLKKAFDTVNHSILLRKLEHYGIRGIPLHWFTSYLSNRKQFVYFNGHISDTKPINCGVPQGSVLGPLLFLLYINDFPNVSSKIRFFLFADDTNLYYESNNLKQMEIYINKELNKIYQWLCSNRLALNITKTNFVIFHPYNKPLKESITLKIHKKAIDEVPCVKYLGVLIDSTLSWKSQISTITKKIARSIGIMYKLRPFVDTKIMKNVYYSIIYPHLIYGIQVWGLAFKTELKNIETVQKRAVRMITCNDSFNIHGYGLCHTLPLFQQLEFLKISDIYKFQLSKFIHECVNGHAPEQFNTWFALVNKIHDHHTRSNVQILNDNVLKTTNFFIPFVRTTHCGINSIKVMGPKIWNEIPNKIRSIKSKKGFLDNLKKYYLSVYTI